MRGAARPGQGAVRPLFQGGRPTIGRSSVALAEELGRRLDSRTTSDKFIIESPPRLPHVIDGEILRLTAVDPGSFRAPVREAAWEELMFARCLSIKLSDRGVEIDLDARIESKANRPRKVMNLRGRTRYERDRLRELTWDAEEHTPCPPIASLFLYRLYRFGPRVPRKGERICEDMQHLAKGMRSA